jgi:hypothetical protein
VEISCPSTANFSLFNTLFLFAPFVCNIIFSHAQRLAEKSGIDGKLIDSKSFAVESRAKLCFDFS